MKIDIKVMAICLLIFTVILTGCWDMVEIDRRLFVGIVGIDTCPQKGKYTFHYSLPVARQIISGEGGGGGGGQGKPVVTESTVAYSITDGARNLALRLNRDLFFEHMRIVVISEDSAKEGINNFINPLIRQTEFNRRSRIAICEGKAKEVIEVTPWVEKLKADYMESIFTGSTLSGKFIEADLGDFLRSLYSLKGNSIVSKISTGKNEVNIGGAAVIKDYRFVGWLDKDETQGINFILGKIRGGDVVVKDPHGVGTVTFTITRAQRKIMLTSKDPIPEFSINVLIGGNIAGTTRGAVLTQDDISKIEDLVSQEVKGQMTKVIQKLQKTYKVDLLELGDYLYKYQPKLWKKYQQNWEEIFPNVKININVDTVVRNIGVIQ